MINESLPLNEKFNQSTFPKHSQRFPNLEHKEAKSRVQLQTEELTMTSIEEGVQETSESERPAVISRQELTASQVIRLAKEVAEQNTKE